MAKRINFSNEQMMAIYNLYKKGAEVKELAKSQGCSTTKIYQIIEAVGLALSIAESSNSKKQKRTSIKGSIFPFPEIKNKKQA